MIEPAKCRVALLAGGTSGEREISLASGVGAGAALREAGFLVTELDPARHADLAQLLEGSFDVAFLCLHGKGGEDGALQGFLETIGLPYTGPGVWSSATAMNKAQSKLFYQRAGIPTAPFQYLQKGEPYSVDEIAQVMGGTCVVKPATEGSALGIYIVEGVEAIAEAIEKVFEIDELVVVEKYISGTELTVAVLGNDQPFALPVIEIVPKAEFYDFDSKYAPGGSQHNCPAPLSEKLTEQVMQAAVNAHKALHCSGVSRSDFILDGEGIPWILETNTIPGMTATSLLPDAARAAGISFPELCTKLIEYAFEDAR
ncbi:D-alanine--D-alanine ligase [Adlercreutzia sp. R25]|uniref:D-alanine--D-alanine ligase n=2 Tax=Adlercreutzia shanghongiae TaxID=3111773 RepID=A0ABU6IVW8_9ACTN|nr:MULTISPECIES: D-alanine--D-alanine ligase [unclassified Adlercreutzia]MEC4272051.1 D-alanine--D-alanine ligase [Adlercreutzia sp. R25]MEC4293782.1 D-alanine--D-alanine ligase [Adlercreutzia sp. R22]